MLSFPFFLHLTFFPYYFSSVRLSFHCFFLCTLIPFLSFSPFLLPLYFLFLFLFLPFSFLPSFHSSFHLSLLFLHSSQPSLLHFLSFLSTYLPLFHLPFLFSSFFISVTLFWDHIQPQFKWQHQITLREPWKLFIVITMDTSKLLNTRLNPIPKKGQPPPHSTRTPKQWDAPMEIHENRNVSNKFHLVVTLPAASQSSAAELPAPPPTASQPARWLTRGAPALGYSSDHCYH